MLLREYLRKHKITAEKFSVQMDVSVFAVIKWMSGQRTPRFSYIKKIMELTNNEVLPEDIYLATSANARVAAAIAHKDRVVPAGLRYSAIKRSKGCCECCGARATGDNPLEIDHIAPVSKRSKSQPKQRPSLMHLQVLCRACNRGKGNRDSIIWRNIIS